MKINGVSRELLELIAVSIDFPCSLIDRFEYSTRNMYRVIKRLIDAGLIKKYRKDGVGSIRLTRNGQSYLLENNKERFKEFEGRRKYSKSEKEKRERLHRIASTYLSMKNAGLKIFADEKPNLFSETKVPDRITSPTFYSSNEIKAIGLECVKIKFCRAVGVVLNEYDDGFIVYNSLNALMKWSSQAEQRVDGVLTGILLGQGIQIDNFAGLVIGKDMELAKRMFLSDGGFKNELFKIDGTFNEFYYVPEDKNGDYLISLLMNREKRNELREAVMEELEVLPSRSQFRNKDGQAVLLAYTFDMEDIRRFKGWLEMFEEEGIVVCFEFQKDVLQDYFGELAKVVVIEMV